jgi:C4-type Zn-finger protein
MYFFLRLAVTTVEGVLTRTVTALEQDQLLRRIQDPEGAAQIDSYLEMIKGLLQVKEPFHIVS